MGNEIPVKYPSETDTMKLNHGLEASAIELEITNNKQILAQDQSEAGLDKYIRFYNSAPAGYFAISREGKILELNPAGAQILGCDPESLRNSRFDSFISENSKPAFSNFIDQLFKNKTKTTCKVSLVSNGGFQNFYLFTGIASGENDHCLVIGTDITDLMVTEEELRNANWEKECIIEGTHAGIWEWNVQTGDTVFNEMWANIIGYTLDELAPASIKTWKTMVHPDDLIKSISLLEQHFAGNLPYYDFECRMKHKNGSWVWVHDRGRLITRSNEGEPLMMFGTHIDITKRKWAEAEIELKNEELQRVNAEKDKFFSIIAHDLRGPFSGFLGLTELLAERLPGMKPDETQQIAFLMRKSATNLFQLLGNLLEWSRMQRGIISFDPVSQSLEPKITESLTFALEAAKKKNITINYELPQDLAVFADDNMLKSIIRNLVSNAVKFTHNGGNITISAKTVPGNLIEISITDTGIGMDQDQLDRLFHIDAKTSRQGTEGESSTGIGLILCKDFITKHGGKLWAKSEVNKGSIFIFTLPGTLTQLNIN